MKYAEEEILINTLKKWNDGKGISFVEWISGIADIDLFIGYSRLFWPKFEELDDCVFLNAPTKKQYEKVRNELGDDKKAIETQINHTHIADLLINSRSNTTSEKVKFISGIIREMWSAKLHSDFPQRRFIVFVEDNTKNIENDFILSFYQQ